MRDAARIERLKVDPHFAGQFEPMAAWQPERIRHAFDVKPGDAMYLAPDQRISLWQVRPRDRVQGEER